MATLQPSDQGMHIVLWLPSHVGDVHIAAQAAAAGIAVRPISPMYSAPPGRSGLMLGFGGFTAGELEAATLQLRDIIKGSGG